MGRITFLISLCLCTVSVVQASTSSIEPSPTMAPSASQMWSATPCDSSMMYGQMPETMSYSMGDHSMSYSPISDSMMSYSMMSYAMMSYSMMSYSMMSYASDGTYYAIDSMGNTICYVAPMSHSEMSSKSPLMSSGAPPPPMSSGAPPPPMSSGAPPPMSSGAPPPPMSSGTPPPPISSGAPPPPMSSGAPPPPMSSGAPPPPMSSGAPPPHMSSGAPPPHMSSGAPPPHMSSGAPPPPMSSGDPPPMSSGAPQPPMSSGAPPPLQSSGTPPMSSGTPPRPMSSGAPHMSSSVAPPPQSTVAPVSDGCASGETKNRCGFCTGGSSGKAANHGVDDCNGMCTNAANYRNATDCAGTCNGTAYMDTSCSDECIGGSTGKPSNYSRDCSNTCDGTFVLDTCNYCRAPYSGLYGSEFKDCNGDCVTPAQVSSMAVVNDCGICTAGQTNKPSSAGKDACGVCSGDNSTCSDCENVPNGGKVIDACNVCGGDGSTCLVVSMAMPDHIPSASESTLNVAGGGLDKANLECYVKTSTGPEVPVSITEKVNAQNITVTVPSTITAGQYKLFCRIAGSTAPDSNVTIVVYDSTAVALTSISPTEFTKGMTNETEVLTLTGTGFSEGNTFCMISGPSMNYIVDATVASATSATCSVNHPAESQALQVSLSLNKVVKIGSPVTVKAQASPPTAKAKFTDTADAVFLVFCKPVDMSNRDACSDIFDNATVTALGADAVCSFVSGTTLFIRGSSLSVGDNVVPKANAIKEAGQAEAIAMTGNIPVLTADNPLSPTVTIIGPSVVGGCIADIVLDAGSSTGRSLTYSWSVNPTTTLTGGETSKVTLASAVAGTTYTFSLTVTNFLSQTTTVTHVVQKTAVNTPELVVTSSVGPTVRVSESFDLIADTKLVAGCVDDTLLYTWSLSDDLIVDNTKKSYQRYTVDANTLPAGRTLTATVVVALATSPSTTTEGTYVFTTEYSDLVAQITGGTEQVIGVNSGSVTLDASGSMDPNNVGDMRYSWQCFDVTASVTNAGACTLADGSNLPATTTDTLTFNANQLIANRRFKFTAEIVSGSRVSRASVYINAVAGNPPKLSINALPNGGYFRQADTVPLQVTIEMPNAQASIKEVIWMSEQGNGEAVIDLSVRSNLNIDKTVVNLGNNFYVAAISIKGGVLEKGQKYRVKVKVIDNSDNEIYSSIEFQTYLGVGSCIVPTVSNYPALSEITVSVVGCVTDDAGGALTYTLYAHKDTTGTLLRLGEDSVSNTAVIPFAPKAYLPSNTNQFSIKVCARKGGCMMATSTAVTVTALTATQITAKKTTVINKIQELTKTSNPLEGAVVLSIYMTSSTASTRRKRDVATTDLHTLMLDLVGNTLANTTKTESTVNTLLDVMSILKYTEMSEADLNRVVSYYQEILTYLEANSLQFNKDRVVSLIVFVRDIKTRFIISSFDEAIRNTIIKSFTYGDFDSYVVPASHTMKISEEFPSANYTTGPASNPVAVNFGTTILEQYDSWTCGSNTCSGVAILSNHYETNKDPYSTLTSDKNERSSDIIDVILVDPLTGAVLPAVTSLAVPVRFVFPLTKPKSGKSYMCKYWDTGSSSWKTDGMVTTGMDSSTVTCTSNHLTSFAAFETASIDESSNLGAIIGGTIAAIVIVVIIVIIIVVVIKKKKENKINSTENLRAAEHGGN
ncbi:mucin-4 [Patella vulgata]|uniref:mucin-4 n=1 Tax=Patella vulgata TaxID=6465 RepID=UPI00217F83F2|nr:mucin-4 [Patella vulgata]